MLNNLDIGKNNTSHAPTTERINKTLNRRIEMDNLSEKQYKEAYEKDYKQAYEAHYKKHYDIAYKKHVKKFNKSRQALNT